MYRIGIFSKINRISVKTLRYYDEVDLLKPAFIDNETGYRYYTSDQLPVLHRILALRQLGFSIDEILYILSDRDVENIFNQRQKELITLVRKSRQQLLNVRHYLKHINDDFVMKNQVIIKELPEVIVYSVRKVIYGYDECFSWLPQLGSEVAADNPELQCREPDYSFFICHDKEYKDNNIDVEFCEAVTKKGKDTDKIKFKLLERVPKAACILHKGTYESLGQTFACLFKWVEENKYTPTQPPREVHINGIWNKNSDTEWLTEIQIPV